MLFKSNELSRGRSAVVGKTTTIQNRLHSIPDIIKRNCS